MARGHRAFLRRVHSETLNRSTIPPIGAGYPEGSGPRAAVRRRVQIAESRGLGDYARVPDTSFLSDDPC